MANLLRKVLLEMEKGLDRDYINKEGFIHGLMEELKKIEEVLAFLDSEKDHIKEKI